MAQSDVDWVKLKEIFDLPPGVRKALIYMERGKPVRMDLDMIPKTHDGNIVIMEDTDVGKKSK